MTLELNLQKGLVGHWTMDDADTSGGTLYDRSANDNHGNLNGPNSGQTGIIGQSFDFNGVDDFIRVLSDSSLSPDVFTLTAWINIDDVTTNHYVIVRNDESGNIQYQLSLDYDGTNLKYRFHVETSGGTDIFNIRRGDASSFESEWLFLCGVYDGSEARLYGDNQLISSQSASGTTGSPDGDLIIGENAKDGGRNVDGLMDDIRVYNRPLSESEINALYNMRSQRNALI